MWAFLAICIGTAGFIVVVTMSKNVKDIINQDLELLGGVTIIKVQFTQNKTHSARIQWFRDATIEAIRHIPGVFAVSKIAIKWRTYSSIGNKFYYFPLIGVDWNFWRVNDFVAYKGRFFPKKK